LTVPTTGYAKIEPRSVIDSAAVLTGLGEASDGSAEAQRQRCLDILKRGQTDEGGWGPYVTSNPEAFDTALVVLALAAQPAHAVAKRSREDSPTCSAASFPTAVGLKPLAHFLAKVILSAFRRRLGPRWLCSVIGSVEAGMAGSTPGPRAEVGPAFTG